MTEYKLNNAIAQSLPGNFEDHYGYKCEVRPDGIYIDLQDEDTIKNFKVGGRISAPVAEKVKEPEVVVEPAPVVETVSAIKTDVVKPAGEIIFLAI